MDIESHLHSFFPYSISVYLSDIIQQHLAVLTSHDRINNQTIVAGRDSDHPLGTYKQRNVNHPIFTKCFLLTWHNHLIVLPDEGGGPHLQPGHVGGLVQHVDVVVRRNADHGQFLRQGNITSYILWDYLSNIPEEPFLFLGLALMKICAGIREILPGYLPGVFFDQTYLSACKKWFSQFSFSL